MIQTLADLQPFLLLALLIVMYSIENFRPYLANPANKKQHDLHNFILTFISIVVNAAVGGVVGYTVMFTAEHQRGLFNHVELPNAIEIVASVLLIDFGSYCNHRLMHKIPFLWRFHRVHHSDLYLNTSTSLRFHPLEVIYSQGIYFCVASVVLGVSMTSFIIYGTLGIIFVIIQHSIQNFQTGLKNMDVMFSQLRAGIRYIIQTNKNLQIVIMGMYSLFGIGFLQPGMK